MVKILQNARAELVEINQSDYGQISLKPTGLLGLNLCGFQQVLRESKIPPFLRKAKRLRMGCRMENGLYTTAPLKEYPIALCDAIAAAILNQSSSTTSSCCPTDCEGFSQLFSSFLSEVEHMNCALPSEEGQMCPDYQGQSM